MTPKLLTAMSTLTETENKNNNIQITKQNKNKKTHTKKLQNTQKNTITALQPRYLARIQH